MRLHLSKAANFEGPCPCDGPVDKEQHEKLEENYKDVIDWACETETRIIIVRFTLLVALMLVVIKKYRKLGKNKATV